MQSIDLEKNYICKEQIGQSLEKNRKHLKLEHKLLIIGLFISMQDKKSILDWNELVYVFFPCWIFLSTR
jgi:hypothetical protein